MGNALDISPKDGATRTEAYVSLTVWQGGDRFDGGIDFNPKVGEEATFYAVAEGLVSSINRNTGQGYDGDKGARNYSIELALSKTIKVMYHFEAALNESGEPLSVAEVNTNIYVTKGKKVLAGDPIGLLPYRCGGSHVHFSIMDETGEIEGMPEIYGYFDEATAQALKDIVSDFNGT